MRLKYWRPIGIMPAEIWAVHQSTERILIDLIAARFAWHAAGCPRPFVIYGIVIE